MIWLRLAGVPCAGKRGGSGGGGPFTELDRGQAVEDMCTVYTELYQYFFFNHM